VGGKSGGIKTCSCPPSVWDTAQVTPEARACAFIAGHLLVMEETWLHWTQFPLCGGSEPLLHCHQVEAWMLPEWKAGGPGTSFVRGGRPLLAGHHYIWLRRVPSFSGL
jgi:hypothetical protein